MQKKLYLQQKLESTKWQCNHLKGIEIVSLTDTERDEVIDIEVCSLCGKEMNTEDFAKRNALLRKFNKLEK